MSGCTDMKKGDIYVCDECGIELQVIKECEHSGSGEGAACHDDGSDCGFMCCDKPLRKK
jgi:hypothetical protein